MGSTRKEFKALLRNHSHYCIFDIDTTGPDNDVNEIIQVSVIKCDTEWNKIDEYSAFIKINESIPQEVTDVTGITNEIIEKEGQPEIEVLNKFFEFTRDCLLIAHFGSSFGVPFLNSRCRQNSLPSTNNYKLDTLELSRYLFPNQSRHKLANLCQRAEVEYDTNIPHDAVANTHTLLQVLINYLIPKLVSI